tara:strand:- start:195 stop:764 length:570 start_codon:yes stop_codon:yes gene_type:complete
MESIPEEFPKWLAFETARAIQKNVSAEAALSFVAEQHEFDHLKLYKGELEILTGNTEAGLNRILSLVTDDSPVGFKAAWTLGLAYIEHGNFNEARIIIESQPRLKNHLLGKEMLARVSLGEGDNEKAKEIYESIKDESVEAKSFLARIALQEEDWETARAFTEEALIQAPENMRLRTNLQYIIDQENSK